jgi:capsular exopolysaccharide synthesis family protein
MNMMNKEPLSSPSGSPAGACAPRGLAEMLGITALMTMLRRRMVVVAIVGFTAAIATLAFMLVRTPTYTATSLLIISPRQASDAAAAGAFNSSSLVNSEIELLRSPALMNELAIALGLQESNGASIAPSAATAESLASALDIRQRADTFVIEIAAISTDPNRAALIANTYADVYIASQMNAHLDGAQQANSWLSRRLAELREDVQEKESAAEQFRAESGLSVDPGQQTFGNLQAQVAQAQADVEEAEARNRRLQELRAANAPLETIAGAFNSDALNALRTRDTDNARRQADLEARYLPNHPAVQTVRAERVEIDAQIRRELQRMSANFADGVTSARARLQSLQQSLSSSAGEISSSSSAPSARLSELEREAAASREVYDNYLERYQDVADQGLSNARLLSYGAVPSAPSSPNLRMALLMTLVIGLGLSLGAGMIAELSDQSVKNAEDIDSKVGYPSIASIPTISKRMMSQMPPAERHPSGYLVGRPMSAFTEALRVLRTVIVYSKLDFSVKVVAVTSALPDEGKTTISMCLARVAAMSGQRVIVVDCDLRKQSINDVIDIETDVGILQVLAGEAPWRSAIIRDPSSDAHVLPVATSGFTPRDVFGSDAMGRLIGDLRAHYDLVILDCAPILAVAETRILVGQADTTLLVARAGRTAVGALRSAGMQTEAAGGRVLGVALNYVLPRWQSYADSLYLDQSKSYYSVS